MDSYQEGDVEGEKKSKRKRKKAVKDKVEPGVAEEGEGDDAKSWNLFQGALLKIIDKSGSLPVLKSLPWLLSCFCKAAAKYRKQVAFQGQSYMFLCHFFCHVNILFSYVQSLWLPASIARRGLRLQRTVHQLPRAQKKKRAKAGLSPDHQNSNLLLLSFQLSSRPNERTLPLYQTSSSV